MSVQLTRQELRLVTDGWKAAKRVSDRLAQLPDEERPAQQMFLIAGATAMLEQFLIAQAAPGNTNGKSKDQDPHNAS